MYRVLLDGPRIIGTPRSRLIVAIFSLQLPTRCVESALHNRPTSSWFPVTVTFRLNGQRKVRGHHRVTGSRCSLAFELTGHGFWRNVSRRNALNTRRDRRKYAKGGEKGRGRAREANGPRDARRRRGKRTIGAQKSEKFHWPGKTVGARLRVYLADRLFPTLRLYLFISVCLALSFSCGSASCLFSSPSFPFSRSLLRPFGEVCTATSPRYVPSSVLVVLPETAGGAEGGRGPTRGVERKIINLILIPYSWPGSVL